jgi:L-seryl-tRNA(Ser) seleniumtransferase
MKPELKVKADPRRELPAVDALARELRAAGEIPEWAAVEAARGALSEERERVRTSGQGLDRAALLARAESLAARLAQPWPRRVVNATGVVLHTNLGRAPLAPGAVAAVAAAAAGYADLEIDLDTGRRGDRLGPVAAKLARLGQAEAALAVNNNAAAVLLALDTLARGREAIVSRGELIEIGGSFRVPEIRARAGVRLVEVGTTNRTHRADYEAAIGPATALLLKVHRSNFEQRGFVAEVGLPELAELARARGLPLVEDLGSGTLVRLPGLPAEAFAPDRLRQGADLVCFSGDKLLGGPQAGLVLGRADLVEALRGNPLARALRLDKLSLAALDWTLTAHLDGRAEREIPVLRQLTAAPAALEARARRLAARLAPLAGAAAQVCVVAAPGPVGGGSLPGFSLPGFAVAVEAAAGAEPLAARLRAAPVPVVGRIHEGRLLLDARTLLDGDDDAVAEALAAALRDDCRRVEAAVRIP